MISFGEILNILIKSRDNRKSRLHDRKGNLVPLDRFLVNGPRAIGTWIICKAFGWRPRKPWISYAANAIITRKLSKTPGTVLEFGSGMSTIWFAQHATRVCSVEHDSQWFHLVEAELNERDFIRRKVEYKLASDKNDYISFKADTDEQFDILLVDGPRRLECLKRHMHLVKKGGLIYLDNSDADSSSEEEGEIERAVDTLLTFAEQRGASVECFTDFAPTSLFAIQGIMVFLPES